MDDADDPYAVTRGFESSHRSKLAVCYASYPDNVSDQYVEGEDDPEVDGEDEEEEVDGNEEGAILLNGKAEDVNDKDDVVAEDGDEDSDDGNPDDDCKRKIESDDQHRHPKKRKMMSLLSSYEFAPRVTAPLAMTIAAPKPSHGGRNALSDWSEHETFVLLDAWGDRFIKHGRKSLRFEEWQEVADKVSQRSKLERSDTQCRNRLDTLKKKYKKEKAKIHEMGGTASQWVYFKKMDMLLSLTPQQLKLSLEANTLNSNKHGVRNPRVYLNRACRLDEMSVSSENSDSFEAEENSSNLLPPKRTSRSVASFRSIAESITKFSDIYLKVENNKRKRKQMLELEKMRMNFHRELEMQRRQILEKARAEIANFWREDDSWNNGSAENLSG